LKDNFKDTSDIPIYNSRVVRTYVYYLREFYPNIDISSVLAYSNMEMHQIEDDNHWFTQEQIDKFHEILEKLINDESLPRKVGRYTVSPAVFGYFRNYILGLLGPVKVYEKISRLASNFVKSSEYTCKILGRNKVEITVIPKPGVHEKFFQCQNRIGYFEAIPLIFGYRIPQIEHPECLFKGDKCCRYIIQWQEKTSDRLKRIQKYIAALMLSTNIASYFLLPFGLWLFIFLSSTLGFFALSSYVWHIEKMDLQTSLFNLEHSADALFIQLHANFNQLLLSIEVIRALSTKAQIPEMLNEVLFILQKRLDFDRALILLADEGKNRLNFAAAYGYTPEQESLLKRLSFNLRRPESRGVFVRSFWEKRPILINDLESIKDELSPRSLEFARQVGAKSFICCPILGREGALGIIAVDNMSTKRPLVQRDVDLLSTVGRELGICIENVNLIERRHKQLMNLIQVLASSLDARDPLTHGHSQRVAEYAYGIAKELGLSDEDCEMIKIAALLHDYGKIAIPDAVLRKNGRLSHVEFEYIKKHAQKTREILDMVGFDGAYAEIPKIAGSHHERFDGSGYPDGLRGDQIPLGGRILAVADVFDALTSPRPYREAYTPEEALKIITTAAGTQFDPEVVKAFIRYYQKTV